MVFLITFRHILAVSKIRCESLCNYVTGIGSLESFFRTESGAHPASYKVDINVFSPMVKLQGYTLTPLLLGGPG